MCVFRHPEEAPAEEEIENKEDDHKDKEDEEKMDDVKEDDFKEEKENVKEGEDKAEATKKEVVGGDVNEDVELEGNPKYEMFENPVDISEMT